MKVFDFLVRYIRLAFLASASTALEHIAVKVLAVAVDGSLEAVLVQVETPAAVVLSQVFLPLQIRRRSGAITVIAAFGAVLR